MELKICKTCGGNLKKIGTYYACEFCGNRWEADIADDVNAVKRANAWETLRNGDFEEAEALFDEIIIEQPKNYEAYWGKSLSSACITYVTDLNECKKVPTCNNITEDSFADNKFVLKAIELAPENIANEYKNQAKYIDKIRVEWLEKARKEPDYDVFISYKDSDKENGIERTQDSIDAQDLYNALTEEGYKVFFSRISLRDKVAEQYEPYIFNAIKTAKVMIVFGEKVKYFSSTWIKNEWTRFKNRIEKKEKHPNSLVVVYKDIDPNDLPVILKSRQCLNMHDVTFLRTLTNHIKKIIDLSKQAQGIEKIMISGGKMAKKSAKISQKTIQVREVGQGALVETSIDDEQSFSLVKTYVKAGQFNQAKTLLDDLLFNNPNNAEFIFTKLMICKRCDKVISLFKQIDSFSKEDYDIIEKTLNCAKKEYAETLIELLYMQAKVENDEICNKILNVVLPFNHAKRKTMITAAFMDCISKSKYESFNTLLSTLDPNNVDRYIKLNLRFAKSTKNESQAIQCLKNVFAVDEGNVESYEVLLDINLRQNANIKDLKTIFEKILSYSSDCNEKVNDWLEHMASVCENACNDNQIAFIKQLIRYYQSDIAELDDMLIKIANDLLKQKRFDDADYFYKLVLNTRKNDPDVYLGICLTKIKKTNLNNISDDNNSLQALPEFNKYLSLLPEDQRIDILDNLKKAKEQYEEKLKKEKEKNEEKSQKINKINKKIKTLVILLCSAFASFIFFLIGLAIAEQSFILCGISIIAFAFINVSLGIISTNEKKLFSGWSTDGCAAGCASCIQGFVVIFFCFIGWIFALIKISKLIEERKSLEYSND